MRRIVPACAILAATALGLAACREQAGAPGVGNAAAPAHPFVVPTADGHYAAEIKAEDFAARVQQLASDPFEGRKPGTNGARLTTAWIKDQFQQIGLKPANRGDWFQDVPMVETTLVDPGKVQLHVKGAQGEGLFDYGSDMIVGTLDASPEVAIEDSDIVFMGYGVDAPEYRWNDYADIDVKGKTVVVLVNDPGWGDQDPNLFKGRTLTYYGRWTYKYEEAARQGAAACFIVHDPDAAGYPWQVVVNSWTGTQDSLPANQDPAPRLKVAGWLTTPAAERLFARAGYSFDDLKKSADYRGFKPTDLKATLSVDFRSTIAHASSDNVLGYIPGSRRPDEVIVYSAHWDHFGKDPALKGDPIYHGAVDNGTGVAGLLEIATAFAHQQPPPERSVLFLATTLEEAGLLGSRYYVTHPAFPLATTVADINMDALPMVGPAKDIAVIGYGESSMDGYIEAAAKAEGRRVVPDEAPEKGFFFRSDQFNFAKMGVPVLYARSGLDLVEGGEAAGRKAYADYTANRYHKPADRYDPDWDFRGVIEDLKAFYAVGRQLAGSDVFPQWKPGADFHRPPEDQSAPARTP